MIGPGDTDIASRQNTRDRARPDDAHASDAAPESADSLLAAVDLGSNSFHMIVAREELGQLHVIDRIKEMVRLSGGLDENGYLDDESQQRALDCLSRFGQRLGGIRPERVRVVGTSTLRRARNSRRFRNRASEVLGHSIDVIAGREEARLIYLGVARSMAFDDRPRLVVDIGGGSTEIIVGQRFRADRRESLEMGCVNLTHRFFADGHITEKRMQRAIVAARLEIEPVEKAFRSAGWVSAFGCSGTIRSAAALAQANGFCEEGLTADAVDALVELTIKAGHIDNLESGRLAENRKAVFPGGLAALAGLFDEIGMNEITISDKSLREGVLYDLQGRLHDDDVREAAVAAMCARHGIDMLHAEQVRETALMLYSRVAAAWEIDTEEAADTLRRGASLHEIGFAVSHSKYHKHGEYLILNTDLDGFSAEDQRMLAAVVRNHRRGFDDEAFAHLPPSKVDMIRRLTVLLRLAVLLHRSRMGPPPDGLEVTCTRRRIQLWFPAGWLDAHPLTRTDLVAEREALSDSGIRLRVKSGPPPA